MFHACVERFDVMGERGNILGWDGKVNKALLDFCVLIRFLCTRSSRTRAKLELGRLECTAHSRDGFLETGSNCGWCICLNMGGAQEVIPSYYCLLPEILFCLEMDFIFYIYINRIDAVGHSP
jgi:hypothetical protein